MTARHQQKAFVSPIGTATPNTIYTQQGAKPACQQDINAKLSHLLLAQLARTEYTRSKASNPHARKTSTQNFRRSYWHTERNLHTARRQAHMPGRPQRKIFASPIGTATPNTIYTQQGAKPARQEDINAKFSHLLLAQLPGEQFTHSKPPNPHASKTSTQKFRICYWHRYPEHNVHTARRQTRTPARHQHKNFRICYWHSYPKRNLHTARRQTRMPARHHRKIFASAIGTATPFTIYTQQGAKPACQEDINTKFSHLLLAQLARTQFTYSKAPNPHARKTSTQNYRISSWHSYPAHNLHTAKRQTRTPARHQRKIFASPIGTATPNTIYTQQGAKPACQQDIITKFSRLFFGTASPNTVYTQQGAKPARQQDINAKLSFSYWHSYPERNLHTARRQTRMPGDINAKFSQLLLAQLPEHNLHTARRQTCMPGRHQRKIGTATPNTIYTQQGAKPACQEDINAKFSHLLLAQLPGTQFTHSKAPNPHASKTSTQHFRISYWHSYPEHILHTASRQTRTPGRHQHKIFASPIGTATPAEHNLHTARRQTRTRRAAEPKRRQSVHHPKDRIRLNLLPGVIYSPTVPGVKFTPLAPE